MRSKRMWIVGGALLTSIAAWLGAQALAPSAPLTAELMPPGALFYVEARNFGKLVSDWDASPEKAAWLKSADYQSFSRSHLLTRLVEARKEFTDAAGVPEEAPLLTGIAGGESAIGFYNIGKLEFLYITQISSARFAESALSKVKQKFQARKAGGRDYFVLSKGDSTIAFAITNERLILATREDLIASSLRLTAGEKIGALRDDRWFAEALAKAPQAGDVRFVADLQKTSRTPQFRSYWIQRNVSEVRQFASVVADLKFEPNGIREDRVFLRAEPQESMSPAESAVGELLRYATAQEAGFYQAYARPSADDVAELLASKLFGHSRDVARPSANRQAPDAPEGPSLLGEDDFDTRIDTPVINESTADVYGPLNTLARGVDAVLQVGSNANGGVLPTLNFVVALHSTAPWKSAEVKAALSQVAGAVWSTAPTSLEWIDRNGASELNSLSPLRFSIDSNVLILSAAPDWMVGVMGARAAAATAGATYALSFRFAQELPGFTRMMRLMDFPALPQGQPADAPREPLFFSENIASLAGAMVRLDSVIIVRHDVGAVVNETVTYRRK